ncbi:MAG: hypothetical protein IT310_01805 [Anaerolineales bacterium]|nr:hypothetical protein [Anaerolineales bacterium]
MDIKTDIEALRTEYIVKLKREIPQRAKGFSYLKIFGPGSLLFLFFVFFVCLPAALIFNLTIFIENELITFIAVGAIGYILVYFPAHFYHNIKRTKRWTHRNYPNIYKIIYKLGEKDKKDYMAVAPVLLRIEGQKYFLATYIRQLFYESQAKIMGYALFTDNCNLIEDDVVFKKAFLTFTYSLIGSVSGQYTAVNEKQLLTDSLRRYMPHSENTLKFQQKYFEQIGQFHDWNNLLTTLPELYAASKDILTVYEGREEFRKSMGYSFGFEYFYDDAMLELEMRQAFCKYVLSAHFQTIYNVRILSAHLIDAVQKEENSIQGRKAQKALRKIWRFALTLSTTIDKMSQEGLPSKDDISLFQKKTKYAKQFLSDINLKSN